MNHAANQTSTSLSDKDTDRIPSPPASEESHRGSNGQAPSRRRRRPRRRREKSALSTPPQGSVEGGAAEAPSNGKTPPNAEPATPFGALALSPDTAAALQGMDYTEPTEIQAQAVPHLLGGRDLVGQAQTGSGKTAAYGIPMVERLNPREGGSQGLVLVPTRELAMQVRDELNRLGSRRGIRAIAVYGGQPIARQIQSLEKRPEIIIATPGRLIDHMRRGTVTLDRARFVVLDEADRMLDVGFADDIEWILKKAPKRRQTTLFSATIPGFIRRMIRRYMHDPAWVQIGAEIQTVDEVEQVYVEVAERDKLRALQEILVELPADIQVLIFCRMQVGVDRLVQRLQRAGHAAKGLHGGMSQGERNTVMQAFRDGKLSMLASTNLSARGIDVPAITHVVNYDMPDNVEEYVHRIGRTARMGRTGAAITFVAEWDLEMFDALQRELGEVRFKRLRLGVYA